MGAEPLALEGLRGGCPGGASFAWGRGLYLSWERDAPPRRPTPQFLVLVPSFRPQFPAGSRPRLPVPGFPASMLPKRRRARGASPAPSATRSTARFPDVAIYLAEPRMGRSRRAFLARLALSKGFCVLEADRCAAGRWLPGATFPGCLPGSDVTLPCAQPRGDTCGDGAELSRGGHLLAEAQDGASVPRLPGPRAAGHQLVHGEHGCRAASGGREPPSPGGEPHCRPQLSWDRKHSSSGSISSEMSSEPSAWATKGPWESQPALPLLSPLICLPLAPPR